MKDKKDSSEDQPVGSLFSPKFTLWSGIILLAFAALAAYRHWALGVPFGFTVEEAPVIIDSLIQH